MPITVSPSLPFSPSALNLSHPSRWTTLLPLLRPSVRPITTSKGQTILLDDAHALNSKSMHVVAVHGAGTFSSALLDEKHITALVTGDSGAGILTAGDIAVALEAGGVDIGPGVVVLRVHGEEAEAAGTKCVVHAPGVLEVLVVEPVERDHVLRLLGTATAGTRANPHNLGEMVKNFVRGVRTVRSVFHPEKVEGNPAVVRSQEPEGFVVAREVVERDVRTAMEGEVVAQIEGRGEGVTYSVHFSDVNGLSRLENYIVVGEIARSLDALGVKYCLSHSTVTNPDETARGFAISICPMPEHFLTALPQPQPHKATVTSPPDQTEVKKTLSPSKSQISFDDKEIRRRIENGCTAVIKEEPTITEYDTIVGDGDCGYTLRDGATKVLDFISGKDLSRLPETVGELVRELEVEMGGTSGALYCIYLTALANGLASEASIPAALQTALNELCKYTNARVGDRTMMDALIPYIETLALTGNTDQALQRARDGVEGTKQMEAKLGRSTYLDESATKGVPDPGAYGLLVLLEGMST